MRKNFTDDKGAHQTADVVALAGIEDISDSIPVTTKSASTNAYGAHIETWGDGFTGIIGVNDDDVIYTSPDITYVNNIFVQCSAGVLDIEVSYDNGSTWRTILFTSVVSATNVATADDNELASGEHTVLTKAVLGTITNFRLNQKGATASNGDGRYGVA